MKKLLLISILINIVFLSGLIWFVSHKGGIKYIKSKFKINEIVFPASYYKRLRILEQLPVIDSSIVFIGNSIIEQCECAELFHNPKVLNRGISHDNIRGVINRAYSIIKLKPEKLFILIGTNDLINGLDSLKFENDYDEMVRVFRDNLPQTKIYLLSILPTDNISRNNGDIKNANRIIKNIAEKNHLSYIDIYSHFLNNNKLNPDFTEDGLHLNGEGYKIFNENLIKFIVTDINR